MNPNDLLTLHDRQQRIDITYHGMRREVLPDVVRHVGLEDKWGIVLYSRLKTENADQVIEDQIDYFASLGLNFEWKFYEHDTPVDLRERLIAQGFAPDEPEALMILDIDHAPAILLRPIALDVRRITEPDQVPSLMKVLEQVWGSTNDWLGQRLMTDLVQDTDHLSVYSGYVDDRAVCAAWIDFHDNQFAGLWGGTTLEEFRGRGFYTSLLAIRLQEAKSRGIRFLVLDASPMSRAIVEKHGFQFVEYTQPHKYHSK
ncbi:MAG TPA: GNAT family N-acetyltransferase [Anaerolineae bacterium]|nr:GNAT family N-acetyltransferase [Anaerolineae bacterium]